MEELQQADKNKLDEKQIKEIIQNLEKGNYITNEFLKEIVNKIEIYSKNRIEIIFNL